MFTSSMLYVLVALVAALSAAQGGVVPVAAPYAAVAPFASSYNAHTIHHNIATPVAAPVVAAPYVAAPAVAAAPYFASPYVAAPAVAAPALAAPYVAPAAYPYTYPILK